MQSKLNRKARTGGQPDSRFSTLPLFFSRPTEIEQFMKRKNQINPRVELFTERKCSREKPATPEGIERVSRIFDFELPCNTVSAEHLFYSPTNPPYPLIL
ncbi:hypothetical protein chiPu_0017022 [Chiloscyllium punctatum]|uniref:Uncharacterized protein n=1 Tax=Chiloscyllium punctatum TaxID=137246 RepID=A0A401T7B1_CHIPU|nr:hypothetical protein [Chiloscyllium punctatum]